MEADFRNVDAVNVYGALACFQEAEKSQSERGFASTGSANYTDALNIITGSACHPPETCWNRKTCVGSRMGRNRIIT